MMVRQSSNARERRVLFRALALLVAMSLLLGVQAPAASATSQTVTGVVVPLFMRPGSAWQVLIQAKLAHPSVPLVAIINPSSGPGGREDFAFASGIQQMQAAGIVVLGYVYTSYGARAASAVQADIDSYHNWYGVDGIMFDEMSSSVSYESYYSTLVQYAKSVGLNFTMGNPGRDVPASYLGIFDSIVIYENTGLPSLSFLGGWHATHPKAGFSFVAIGVSSLDMAFVQSASSHVGYLYITDDVLPNPYDTVPAYFPDLMAALDPGNQSDTVTPPTDVQTTNETVLPSTNVTVTSQVNVTVTQPTNVTEPLPTNVTVTQQTNPIEVAPTNVTILTPAVSTNGNLPTVDSPAAVALGSGSLAEIPSAANQKGNLQPVGQGPDLWPAVAGALVSVVFLLLIPRSIDAASAARGFSSSSARPRGLGLWSRSDLLRRYRSKWRVNLITRRTSGRP